MTRRTRIVLIALTALTAAAWINAAQEKRAGCQSCSPAVDALARIPASGGSAVSR